MPRPPNPEVRARLLSAGGRVVHSQGFHASGVQDITAAAEVPKGSFYSYFESKEAFAAAVLEEYWTAIEESHGAVLYDARIKPLTRIRRFFELLADDHATHGFRLGCLIGNLTLELASTSDEVRQALASILSRWETALAACLEEAQARHELPTDRDVRGLAARLVEGWEGAILRCKVERTRQACDRFQKITLPGLLS